MQAQAQRTDTKTASYTQSLVTIQTLLRAGLGCITYLRDLLPHDNFSESQLTTYSDCSSPFQSMDSNSSSSHHKRQGNGFKIMTMTRGYTDEADRLLNYMENGIFEAIEKQYLKSFVFGIYLDSNDPNNMVETYTFNFQYHTIPGTDVTVPLMTLGDRLNNMTLGEKDPVAEAIKIGKIPTMKDVKRSVKTLLKTLITSMNQMEQLPKRRFASFKLFYTEKAPVDYEPPYFRPGDPDQDKWYFMTHALEEAPERISVGSVNTGHHAVHVSVSSIASYLPSSTEHNNALFGGIAPATRITRGEYPLLTPAEEAAIRADENADQMADAEVRTIVWTAEGIPDYMDVDAEGEDDPDFVGRIPEMTPVGVRTESGEISAIIPIVNQALQYGGPSQAIPTHLDDINISGAIPHATIQQTQSGGQDTPHHASIHCTPSQDMDDCLSTPKPKKRVDVFSCDSAIQEVGTDTQMLQKLIAENAQTISEDDEMLDLETQGLGMDSPFDDIESFTGSARRPIEDDNEITRKVRKDEHIDCDCGIESEDAACFCEGGCKRWFHIWCMGYHAEDDKRLPAKFHCFDCRVRADPSWELIKVDLYGTMISKFKDLALFRRSIKTAEVYEPGNSAAFAKAMRCDNTLARQQFKRLELEGFIVEETTITDAIGLLHTRSIKGKAVAKNKGKARRTGKAKFVFNRVMLTKPVYLDYFDPGFEVETRMLDLPQPSKLRLAPTPFQASRDDSQTQDDTQMLTTPSNLKRNAESDIRPTKRTKVSLAPGIDLAE